MPRLAHIIGAILVTTLFGMALAQNSLSADFSFTAAFNRHRKTC